MGDELLTIGELSRRTGVATSALRYYEEVGLLRHATRISGQRRYPPEAVGVVGAILLLRDAFTLDEIRRLMAARSKSPRSWRELARSKIVELDERIEEARAARFAIQHALECPYEDIVDCPSFQQIVLLRLAGKPLEGFEGSIRMGVAQVATSIELWQDYRGFPEVANAKLKHWAELVEANKTP